MIDIQNYRYLVCLVDDNDIILIKSRANLSVTSLNFQAIFKSVPTNAVKSCIEIVDLNGLILFRSDLYPLDTSMINKSLDITVNYALDYVAEKLKYTLEEIEKRKTSKETLFDGLVFDKDL